MQTKLNETQKAFDSVAAEYDGPTGNNFLIQRFRQRLLRTVATVSPEGARLLDVGCGTGIDAVALAESGYEVTAIDWSPEMVRRTSDRVAAAGLNGRVHTKALGAQQIDALPVATFDAAYSDLGPLNCAPDLAQTAASISKVLREDGKLVVSVIGRFCPWEIALYLLRGNVARATIRLARGHVPVSLNGGTVWTRYYTPAEFEKIFRKAGFSRVSLRTLGLFVPPPYLAPFAARHPRLVKFLQSLEDLLGELPPFRSWGDHFLIVLEKKTPGTDK